MKVLGKLTKTEWLLLALAAAFLLALALLYREAADTAAGVGYTITTQRGSALPAVPELPAPRGPVDINTADLDELQTLDGIGPALAGRIIEYREAHGPFQSVEVLLEVKGIGEATLEQFREDVTAGDGQAMEEDTAA